jgi:sigma-B regulation protein RsbU (phosphoserine phosphatase)
MAYQQTKPEDAAILIICQHHTNHCKLHDLLKKLSFTNLQCKKYHHNLITELHDLKPDLLILYDSELGQDKILLLTEIRQHFLQEELAIILYSSNEASREKAWEHKISDYIASCVTPYELKSRLIFHIHNIQQIKRLKNFEFVMQNDIKNALILQQSLMPQKTTLTEIEKKFQISVNFLFKPCQHLSGDLWGIVPLDNHRFGIWICDFVSKGLHAALSTFRIHTLIKDQLKSKFKPSLLLQILNNKLKTLLNVGNFATFLYGVVDISNNTFTYAAAGSTSPILYNKKNNQIILADSAGLPLGIENNIRYAERTIHFEKDTSLLLYSDLLWECLDDLGFSFDDNDINHFFNLLDGQPVIPYIEKRLDEKNEKLALSDDLTLIEITF